jgi:hypothetical protein
MNELGPYYGGQKKLLLCPAAAKPKPDMAAKLEETGRLNLTEPLGSTFRAWLYSWDQDWTKWTDIGDYGSYGRNGWVSNPRPELKELQNEPTLSTKYNFRKANVKGTSNIPVLLDGAWFVGWPLDNSWPPAFPDFFQWQMGLFCMDRHPNGTINGVFMDSSVRKIGLKQLWTLKWSRNFNTNGRYTKAGGMTPGEWPEWMRRFKDY